jgi:hypothetical protein
MSPPRRAPRSSAHLGCARPFPFLVHRLPTPAAWGKRRKNTSPSCLPATVAAARSLVLTGDQKSSSPKWRLPSGLLAARSRGGQKPPGSALAFRPTWSAPAVRAHRLSRRTSKGIRRAIPLTGGKTRIHRASRTQPGSLAQWSGRIVTQRAVAPPRRPRPAQELLSPQTTLCLPQRENLWISCLTTLSGSATVSPLTLGEDPDSP